MATTTKKATTPAAAKKVTALEKKVTQLEAKVTALANALDAPAAATPGTLSANLEKRVDACVNALCSNDFARGSLQSVSARVRSKTK